MNTALRIWILIRRELLIYLASPIPYIFIVCYLVLNAVITFVLSGFFDRGEADLGPTFFSWMPWLFLGLVPALGMRIWSEEIRTGTIEVLMTMPLKIWHVVLGKFLSAVMVLWLAILLTFPIPLTVIYLGDPDIGAIASGYLGAMLMGAAYLAIACVCSSMTSNQVIAFIVSIFICLMLILAGYSPVTDAVVKRFPDARWLVDGLSSIGITSNYAGFTRGVIRMSSILYFSAAIAICLYQNCISLSRWKKA